MVVGDGSIITDTALKHCVIGIRAMVHEGSQLEDVVMMGADFYESEEEVAEIRPRPPRGRRGQELPHPPGHH